jgi:hypothetical protein
MAGAPLFMGEYGEKIRVGNLYMHAPHTSYMGAFSYWAGRWFVILML